MNINCLIAIKSDSPLNLPVEMLLTHGCGLQAVRSRAVDFQSLMDEICSLRPRVVMIEDALVMKDCAIVTKILAMDFDLKVVVVSGESNHIRVFRKDEILLQNASEFLEIIQTK